MTHTPAPPFDMRPDPRDYSVSVMSQRTKHGYRVLLRMDNAVGHGEALLLPKDAERLADVLREYAAVCRGEHPAQLPAPLPEGGDTFCPTAPLLEGGDPVCPTAPLPEGGQC